MLRLRPGSGGLRHTNFLRRQRHGRSEGESHLSEVLKQMPEVTAHLSDRRSIDLLDPRNYLGSAQRFIHE